MSGHRKFSDLNPPKPDSDAILARMRQIMSYGETDIHAYLASQREFLELWLTLDAYLTDGGRPPREWFGFPTTIPKDEYDKLMKELDESRVEFIAALDNITRHTYDK